MGFKHTLSLLTAALLSSCSTIQQRSNYLFSEVTEETRPVCSLYHPTNGAVLVTTPDAFFVVEAGRSSRTLLAGPPLIPFIPIHTFSGKLSPSLHLQVLPRTGNRIDLLLDELKVTYDDRAVEFGLGSYRKKGDKNSEVTEGLVGADQLKAPFLVDRPTTLELDGSTAVEAPEVIEVLIPARVSGKTRTITLKFTRDTSTTYRPLLLPHTDGPVACATELPTVGKSRSFF